MTDIESGLVTKVLQTNTEDVLKSTIVYNKVKFNNTIEIVNYLVNLIDPTTSHLIAKYPNEIIFEMPDDEFNLSLKFTHIKRGKFKIVSTKMHVNNKFE